MIRIEIKPPDIERDRCHGIRRDRTHMRSLWQTLTVAAAAAGISVMLAAGCSTSNGGNAGASGKNSGASGNGGGNGSASSASGAADTSALQGRITLTGASTISPLVAEIGKRFETRYPAVRIDVQTGGSSRGIADASRGTADIGMTSRPLTEAEQATLITHPLANDGVCMLVHASNPVSDLTDDQIRAIYTGRLTNWRDAGGHDAPITVVTRADGRSEVELVTAHLSIKPADIRATLIAGENQHALKTAASDPNAIVFMSVGAAEFEAARGASIKLLKWNGIEASARNVANGSLPLRRPLLLVTPRQPTPLVKAFLDFARSREMHDLVRNASYVPLE
jgi:phosphate transport system substrate-binding protein